MQPLLLGYVSLFALATAAHPAMAQDQDNSQTANTAEEEIEEVVITGSRIRRTNASSPIPLQVFNVADLQEGGSTDLAEIINQLPGVSESVSPQNSNNLIQTSGLSTISLRRLGDDRTLVLIDGKRAVSNSGNSDRVSLSTLPVGFVKRTEITTGGASAIYGSDAIAGVANFILEDSFKGYEIDGRYSTPEASGGEEYRINFLTGQTFADDRGYVLFGASYRNENEVRADDSRPLSVLAIEFDDPISSTGSDGWTGEINFPGCGGQDTENHCLVPSRSSSTPGGWFESGDAWFKDGRWFNDQGGDYAATDRPDGSDGYIDVDGFNFRPGRTLLSDREVFNAAVRSTFELTETIEASFMASFSKVDTISYGGYETINSSDTLGDGTRIGDIASDHPFIPEAVEETRSGTVFFGRRAVELGEQARINDRRTLRLIGGLEGNFADNYDWEVYGTYGRFKQVQDNPNELNFLNVRNALTIESDGSGGYQCVDADARADGCVPLNIFGEGTITEAAADYIRYHGHAEQVREQITFGASITGPVFDLPAGEVRMAAGIEYRYESQDTDGDPDGDDVGGFDGDPDTSDYDITSLATFPSMEASYDVIEAFAEVDIPVTSFMSLQGAARAGHYNTVGTIFSYNAGTVVTLSEDIRLRGQYSLSQRAPNLTELFSPARPDADDLIDPCNGLNPDGSGLSTIVGNGGENADLGVVAANCLSEAGIQQFFVDNPGDPFEFEGSVQGPNAGNADVHEETAHTLTVGAVLTPSFIPDLTIIADYYRIKINDAITSVSTQDTVSLCYAAEDFPNNKYCDRITRNAFDGTVDQVLNPQENLVDELVEGIDATVLYKFGFDPIPGKFDIDFRYSHYFKQETSFIGIADTLLTSSPLGEIGNGKDEFRAKLGYRNGPFRVTYTVTYYSGGVDDIDQNAEPDNERYYSVPGFDIHRIYASYRFGSDDQYRVYAGVNNLFDSYGKIVPTGLNYGSDRNITSRMNDALGREFYLGMKVRF